jgi:hypothetical protein
VLVVVEILVQFLVLVVELVVHRAVLAIQLLIPFPENEPFRIGDAP